MQAIPVSRGVCLQRACTRPAAVTKAQRRVPTSSRPGRLIVVAAKGKSESQSSTPPADVAHTVTPEWVQQPDAYATQQPYTSVPQYPMPPPQPAPMPAAAAAAPASGMPWYVWVGVGFLVANVAAKAMQFANPAKMQEVAMQQMMKQMMKQMGGEAGGAGGQGASPFGFPPGGFPGGFPTPPGGAGSVGSPFGGAPGANPFAAMGANPFASGTPPVDTTATPAGANTASSSTSTTTSRPAEATVGATAAAPPAGASSSGGGDAAKASSSSSNTKEDTKSFTFTDVDVDAPASSAAASGSNGSAASQQQQPASAWTPPAGNFFEQQAAAGAGAPPSGGAAAEPAGEERARSYLSNMESMLKNPEMQKMLYPYLPEPMRNPETFEWMLNDPTTRKQLEETLASANLNFDPAAMESMMNNVPSPDSPEFRQQFEAIGMKPEDMMQKLISDPELMQAFQNPKVQKAVMELSTNPMAIMNYQNDPEVMLVLNKLQTMMAPAMAKMEQNQAGGGGMPQQ